MKVNKLFYDLAVLTPGKHPSGLPIKYESELTSDSVWTKSETINFSIQQRYETMSFDRNTSARSGQGTCKSQDGQIAHKIHYNCDIANFLKNFLNISKLPTLPHMISPFFFNNLIRENVTNFKSLQNLHKYSTLQQMS